MAFPVEVVDPPEAFRAKRGAIGVLSARVEAAFDFRLGISILNPALVRASCQGFSAPGERSINVSSAPTSLPSSLPSSQCSTFPSSLRAILRSGVQLGRRRSCKLLRGSLTTWPFAENSGRSAPVWLAERPGRPCAFGPFAPRSKMPASEPTRLACVCSSPAPPKTASVRALESARRELTTSRNSMAPRSEGRTVERL